MGGMTTTRSPAGAGLLTEADAEKLRGLRRMKALATGLLVAVAVVYALATWAEHSGAGAWAGYVAAAAEAGMVGALADWFAVTALFRHPLGLRIPHTAIIPTKKDQLGQSLGDFVGENFLSEQVVRDKLRSVALAHRLGHWLARPENADRVTAELATAVRGGLRVLRDADVQAVLAETITRRAEAQDISPGIGRLLEKTVADDGHRRFVDLMCAQAHDWLVKHRDAVLTAVEGGAPGWTPRFVDRRVGDRVYRELLRFVTEMRDAPDHPARGALDRFLADFAHKLQHDEETRARVERLKSDFLTRPEVQELIASAWANVRAMILTAAEDERSALRRRARTAVLGIGNRLATDDRLRAKLDGWVADATVHIVSGYRAEITSLISDTVAGWDARTTSRKIELHIGRDLQFIRLNGTVIGALAGLVIHAVTSAAGG
ncbi:putative membrane protein [Streptomyces sp. MP131-18]|nr:putative membrane protein [Streptomyces sp. MP131-18]